MALARSAGQRALQLERSQPLDGVIPSPPFPPLPAALPPQQAASGPAVISMALRSATPEARALVLATVLRLPELLPGWRLRLVPQTSLTPDWLDWLNALTRLGAEVALPDPLLPPALLPLAHLQVIAAPGVGRWLLLDDAHPLTAELAGALRQWQAGQQPVQLHRWCWDQAQLLPLAGLAARAGQLPDLLAWLAAQPRLLRLPPQLIERELVAALRAHWAAHPPPAWDPRFGASPAAPPAHPLAAPWLQPWLVRCGVAEAQSSQGAGHSLVCASLAWPGQADAPPGCGRALEGFYINLAGAPQRRARLEAHLAELPWAAGYRRFPAHGASAGEARALGLASAGELGIWRSLLALLQRWLADDPPADALLHVLEDDALLHPDLAAVAHAAFTAQPQLHLLFSDAYLTPELYLALLAERQRLAACQPRQFGLVAGEHYRACLSSCLLSVAGARRLLAELEAILADHPAGGPRPLPPVDLAVRGLICAGRLQAAITLPFCSTVTDQGDSAIQQAQGPLQRSQQLDLQLRRLLYAGDAQLSEPALLRRCQRLLAAQLSAAEQRELIGVALRHGRARGWLPIY